MQYQDELVEAVAGVLSGAGITLTEKDVEAAVALESTLKPDGYPSMRQDAVAGRPTEVDLFAGTVIELGRRYGIPTPVNEKYRALIKQ